MLHKFLKKWIHCQLYGDMTIEDFGSVWSIDYCIPISSFNLLDENEMRKCFGWVNLRPVNWYWEQLEKGKNWSKIIPITRNVYEQNVLRINMSKRNKTKIFIAEIYSKPPEKKRNQ